MTSKLTKEFLRLNTAKQQWQFILANKDKCKMSTSDIATYIEFTDGSGHYSLIDCMGDGEGIVNMLDALGIANDSERWGESR